MIILKRGFKSKLAQSQVISTVLLIMLVIVIAFIIMEFVLPFVTDSLAGSECLDLTGKVEIKNNPKYSCYTVDAGRSNKVNTHVQVHVGDVASELGGIVIEVGRASSKSYKIYDGKTLNDVEMYDGSSQLELPESNEERTYVIYEDYTDAPDYIKVYARLEDNSICEGPSTLEEVDPCI
jgi:hypothetical protein